MPTPLRTSWTSGTSPSRRFREAADPALETARHSPVRSLSEAGMARGTADGAPMAEALLTHSTSLSSPPVPVQFPHPIDQAGARPPVTRPAAPPLTRFVTRRSTARFRDRPGAGAPGPGTPDSDRLGLGPRPAATPSCGNLKHVRVGPGRSARRLAAEMSGPARPGPAGCRSAPTLRERVCGPNESEGARCSDPGPTQPSN